jgi:hypothetical protein
MTNGPRKRFKYGQAYMAIVGVAAFSQNQAGRARHTLRWSIVARLSACYLHDPRRLTYRNLATSEARLHDGADRNAARCDATDDQQISC